MANIASNFLTGIFGSRNQRLLKRYQGLVDAANALEPTMMDLDDAGLRARTDALKARYEAENDLDALLPEAFAVVREAARRTLGMRHFDVQLIGGITLHQGKISEMRTGEGKTLVATLAAYLNALTGRGVHVVTVNDYLAQRDADWMGPVYRFLGLTVGVVKSGQSIEEKRAAYASDITYGTNNEFGFDYLRDNLAFRIEDKSQRELAFAIVDEVDSILIDEARTPLIISGRSEESTELYVRINTIIPKLKPHDVPPGAANEAIEAPKLQLVGVRGEELGVMSRNEALATAEEGGYHVVVTDSQAKPVKAQLFVPGDYTVDEKAKQAHLTEEGQDRIEGLLARAGILEEGQSLYDPANIRLMHHLTAALRAHAIYKREVDYIVKDGEVIIVDVFTGRTMPGRRWSDGLHQAVEAKEGVRVKEENQTVASITFQNYFRLYDKLAGMTGTADTEAYEFQQIYGLEVVVIPTHKPMVRDDAPDLVYLSQEDKFAAILDDIEDCYERKQPVLVGTTSIETSELLSSKLGKRKIPHNVLNAKYHEREAEIVMQAGRPGAVTIATNMAGRGTDIVLGGSLAAEKDALGEGATPEQIEALEHDWRSRHAEVIGAGGLHIVGTERHESRRIDNQLRGRSGRQGDPGSSRFYLSMEDNLMRIFGDPERTKRLLSVAGMKAGEAIESRLLSRQIERAQRKVVYQQRTELMESEDVADAIVAIREEVVDEIVSEYIPPESVEELWDVDGLTKALEREFGLHLDMAHRIETDETLNEPGIRKLVLEEVVREYEAKTEQVGERVMRELEKGVMLRQLDAHWKEHIGALDYLRQGIGLRSFAQKNPKQEYKREAFDMFGDMLDRVKRDTIMILSRIQIRRPEDVDAVEAPRPAPGSLSFQHAAAPDIATQAPPGVRPLQGPPARAVPGQPGSPQPGAGPAGQPQAEPFVREQPKVGRNQPCPCGSGKKYKQCHGQLS